MPRHLTEETNTMGPETISSVVFGKTSIGESLLEWSKKVAVGTTFTKTTSWGLILDFIAQNENPCCVIKVDDAVLEGFLRGLGPITQMIVESYGFSLVGPMEHSGDAIEGQNAKMSIAMKMDGGRELHKYLPCAEKNIWGLGCIIMKANGFWFYSLEETMALLAEGEVSANTVQEATAPAQVEEVEEDDQYGEDEIAEAVARAAAEGFNV